MVEASGFCVHCGRALAALWAFCPGCGAQHVEVETTTAQAALPRGGDNADVVELMEAKRWPEAEAMLRARLKLAPAAAGLVLLADLLFRTSRIQESGELLDAAVSLEPANPKVLLRRAQHLAKLGFYQRALADVEVARHYIVDSDVRLLVYSHELERTLQEQAKHSFVRQSALPRLPSWLTGRGRRGAVRSAGSL